MRWPLALIIVFIAAALFGLTSCEWTQDKRPSVLVIAIDALSFDKISCDQSQVIKGFATFCEEAIRFTHNFTPSTMSQAALSSLLTAKYPMEHEVWHNGAQFLSQKLVTSSEVALKKGYRTSFFSGGPPIFKKSGLGQGFETFEDYVNVRLNNYYRPAYKNFNRFLNWLKFEVEQAPFFSMIYVADLQFRSEKTKSDLGIERSQGYPSQLQEVGESLDDLIKKMKKMQVWYNTHVILVGLTGYSPISRPQEMAPTSLYSENVQTPLFIKPSQKIRDKGINWKIDRNVSIVDLGATLFDILGDWPQPQQNQDLEVTSLVGVMDRPDVAWNSDRYILIESAFPQWRKQGGSRFSVRSGHYSLIYDKKIKIYNTLIDRNEINPISHKDQLWQSIFAPIEKYLKDNGLNQ